ncbi:SigB/SigF/SigG family RNA polymerase sigma factor [Actinoplanes sp. DH11]|uniref:SigB/SigF/SigG family RNA polymerase sigma factor n=1 Tax=Actinoplanes sp. DH11 TaxID=2857011 RepID=UPI001E40D103|nr:SigB/SigF/SigG family RNA polymerase sigma factor [Actinoplanes sp. DH11]
MPGAAGASTLTVADPPASSPASAPDDILAAMAALPHGHPARPALRARAIEAWLPMAGRLASRYRRRGEPDDDLVQAATVGLIKAVDRFDPERGIDFAGYAIPTVIGELKRYFRDTTWAVRVPRRLQDRYFLVTAATRELTQQLGRPPSAAEIAGHLGVAEEQVREGFEGARVHTALLLSTPIGHGGRRLLGDTLGGADHGYDLVEARAALQRAMTVLDHQERTILILRFYGNQSQAEIGSRVGMSQMQVSRVIARSLRRLRQEIRPDDGHPESGHPAHRPGRRDSASRRPAVTQHRGRGQVP